MGVRFVTLHSPVTLKLTSLALIYGTVKGFWLRISPQVPELREDRLPCPHPRLPSCLVRTSLSFWKGNLDKSLFSSITCRFNSFGSMLYNLQMSASLYFGALISRCVWYVTYRVQRGSKTQTYWMASVQVLSFSSAERWAQLLSVEGPDRECEDIEAASDFSGIPPAFGEGHALAAFPVWL